MADHRIFSVIRLRLAAAETMSRDLTEAVARIEAANPGWAVSIISQSHDGNEVLYTVEVSVHI